MELREMIFSADFLYTVLRVATPIIFATLAATIATKAGIFNIAIEGIMLIAALIGVVFSAIFQSAGMGLLFAVLIGGLTGFILGVLALRLKTDVILAGVAINLMAIGGTVFLLYLISGDRGVSSSIDSVGFVKIAIPLIKDIPVIGTIFSGHTILTYLAFVCVILLHIFLYKTPLGLKIRAVGENPHAAESVGINVNKIQYIAVTLSGMLAAFGGAFLSMAYLSWFTKGMTAGRGFIGLAASAMGGSTPIGGMLVALLFGVADASANTLQTGTNIPYQLVNMLPYITVIVGLSIYSYTKMQRAKGIKSTVKVKKNKKEKITG